MSSIKIIAVPCFAGAPWRLEKFPGLVRGYQAESPRLPDGADTIEAHAEPILAEMARHERVVLVGDSYGALVSIAAALLHPPSLAGLVLSGGFASDPNISSVGQMRAWFGRTLPRSWYKAVTLRAHASALGSPHDAGGEVPWTARDSYSLFAESTPWESYTGRLRSIRGLDYRDRLHEINVPTLVLSPSYDKLVGRATTEAVKNGISGSEELILEGTGHMFRFSHPHRYEQAVIEFVERRLRRPVVAAAR